MSDASHDGRQAGARGAGGGKDGAHDGSTGGGRETGAAERQDGLGELIGVLRRAGLDPDEDGLADALWLAQFCRPPGGPGTPARGGEAAGSGEHPPGSAGAGAVRNPSSGTRPRPGPEDPPDPPATTEEAGPPRARPPRQDERVTLYTDPGAAPARLPQDALRIGVPEARSLPGLLDLERALRPLRRYRPPAHLPGADSSRRASRLDERETADRTARAAGLLIPVFRAGTHPEAELQLLMDASPAMRVWQRMLGELAGVFARLGAFRDIQVHYLHETPGGGCAVSRRFDTADGTVLGPARRLADPTGRRVTVVVSDCAGAVWRSGAAHRLLHDLTRYGAVAVVQPLPQRLWPRTRLPASYGRLTRDEGPMAPARLRFTAAPSGTLSLSRAGTVPVPLLPPTPESLGAWARLLAGPGGGSVPAAVGWVRADQPRTDQPRAGQRGTAARPGAPQTPAARVARFRATSSPGAVQLAVYLSAAPLFLPVMQLIQRTMLPDSGPAELSEVMLGGLLRRAGEPRGDGRWFEFADGVHEELLAALAHDEALLVLKHCSLYIERRFGRTGPNFPALALAQLSGDAAGAPPLSALAPGSAGDDGGAAASGTGRPPQPFAEVAARVLRRFLPEAAADSLGTSGEPPRPSHVMGRARSLAGQFAADGRVQHLLEAVHLLRQATQGRWSAGRGSDPDLWSELAETLLQLWHVERDTERLTEAVTAARAAAAHPGSMRARTVLARTLHTAAGEHRAAGDERRARDLWRQADREFAAVCATPGLERSAALGFTLERVQVLEAQWQLGGDTALLQESVGMVEAVADAWPAGEPQPSGLALAHGRALLRLAGAAPDAERTRVNAEQAAGSLERGCQALRSESAPAAERVRALLDLVDALLLAGELGESTQDFLAQARKLAGDGRTAAACLVRSGRLHARRYAAGGPADELAEAVRRFESASRGVPRDRPEYSEVIEEWGAALLTRALRRDGGAYLSQAVRVLRDCRMETPAGDPRLPERLLMLGRALAARYRHTVDLVDLREAEHLFSRAAQDTDALWTRAGAWFELGEAHRRAFRHTGRPERLDAAADAYRRCAAAASAAQAERARVPESGEVVRLAAAALHRRGTVYETAGRPLAAAEAYRAALEQWRRLPEQEAGEAARASEERLAALERTP